MSDIEEENFNEPVVKYTTIGNLENAKKAFFNSDFETFKKELTSKPYKYYKCNYKFNDDYEGRPTFVARNLNNGFVKELDEFRKYFMVCFRCDEKEPNTKKYNYTSLWIVNTTDNIEKIISSRYDDFEWNEITIEDSNNSFFDEFKKTDDIYISEEYLH